MYIEKVKNRNSPPCILLRESYRANGKVCKKTIANLTSWPQNKIEGLRLFLKGGKVVKNFPDAFEIIRSRPHGHVAAALGTIKNIGLEKVIDPAKSLNRDLVIAMIVARIINPASKLATARQLGQETLSSSLGELLEISKENEFSLYKAMDWLLERQQRIEDLLANKHLDNGSLVLYDITSTYFEGTKCPLTRFGYSRDRKRGKPQIVFGLLCNAEGCPIAIEVFKGNTSDQKTLIFQIKKIIDRFKLNRIILVGDRGMITEARIREDIKKQENVDIDWITALTATNIKKMLDHDNIQLSMFDQADLVEILSPDYPGERLIACKNPLLAMERGRRRERLLQATEKELDKIVIATKRKKNPLKGKKEIGLRIGKVINKYKVAKHFEIEVTSDRFSFQRKEDKIIQETLLDGVYIVRTSVKPELMDSKGVVRAYKKLSMVERAFRCIKTVDLKVRPIYHHLEERVRAHVFLCMLAYYVEWHMRKKLAPILFDDEDAELMDAARSSVVAPSLRSPSAEQKARSKKTQEELPVHSFQTLLDDLATITTNLTQPKFEEIEPFEKTTIPTSFQQKVLDLLGVKL